jgi:hypothetical protein
MKRMSSGRVAMADPAIRAPHSVLTGLCRLRRPAGRCKFSGCASRSAVPMKLFQLAMKVMRPSVPSAGFSRGSDDAPVDAEFAAAVHARGLDQFPGHAEPTNWRIRKMPKALAAPGM